MTNPFVFVSYSTSDAAFAQQLFQDLQAAGIAVWMDKQGLKAGTPDWEQAIREAIRDAYAIVLVASPDSRDSRYVRDELLIGEMYQRKVIAIWSRGEHWPECVRMGYIGTQYADARDGKYHNGLLETVNALREFSSILENKNFQNSSLPKQDFRPRNPYKGLRAFTSDDRGDFFGRSKLIEELVDALKENTKSCRFLAVVGASGSGKSSVVMAGLIPRLQSGVLDQSDKWIYLEPVLPGSQPLESLAAVLANPLNLAIGSVIDELDRSSRSLSLLAKQLNKGRRDGRVVLLIDQFEELFTQTTDEDKRSHFIDLLVTASSEDNGQLIILITLRADFYDRPMNYPELGKLIERRTKSVLPMSAEDLREAIEKPAALPDVKLNFEAGLVGDLVFEVRGQAGTLPLLQFALDQLVEKRQGHLMTNYAYTEIGGVKGALAKHAETIYRQLPSDRHRELARSLFLRLVEHGATDQDITRRRMLARELISNDLEITSILEDVSSAFIENRLLTANSIANTSTIDISHEALIREWERLSKWVSEKRDDIRLQQRLSRDVHEWIERGKSEDELYRGSKLIEVQKLSEQNLLSNDEMDFIARSENFKLEQIAYREETISVLERLRAILDSMRDGIILLDDTGHIIEVSPSAERLLGINLREHINDNLASMLLQYSESSTDKQAGYSREELVKLARITRLAPQGITRREFTRKMYSNQTLYIEEIGSPVIDENNHLVGRLLVLRDITEEKLRLISLNAKLKKDN